MRARYSCCRIANFSNEHFWSHVELTATGCWEWTGHRDPAGYGRFDKQRAHRHAYELAYGPIPKDRPVICHDFCDNPPCIRPTHLLAGTQTDNVGLLARQARGKVRFLPDDGLDPITRNFYNHSRAMRARWANPAMRADWVKKRRAREGPSPTKRKSPRPSGLSETEVHVDLTAKIPAGQTGAPS